MHSHILIVDDHPAVGIGTKDMLERNMRVRASYVQSAKLAIEMISRQRIDIVLCDWQMPVMNGIELCSILKDKQSDVKVMMYSGYELEPHFNEMMDARVNGFVSKSSSSDELIQSLQSMIQGNAIIPIDLLQRLRSMDLRALQKIMQRQNSYITDKEKELLEAISLGSSNRELADKFHISQRGVEYQLSKLFEKLQVRSRAKAVTVAIELGYIPAKTSKG
ncbi:response regulator transcription factor [Paenibacillus endoradicis]|uniref:response regulator transcription factor n=1 Tax=Paenibacillus endoradicis TaxID=2972487 RepID=UPI002158C9F8|nr:response regulator transcription factor [Paenibacillus endoradicis]MCR8657291.1 response regulator transcription factor [Paenibacillus endoradicis]